MNPMVTTYLEHLARNADDPELADLTENLNISNEEMEDTGRALVEARVAFLTAKFEHDKAYAQAILDATESNKEKREAQATLATLTTATTLHDAELAFRRAEWAHESSLAQFKVLRHIVVARYGGLERYGF